MLAAFDVDLRAIDQRRLEIRIDGKRGREILQRTLAVAHAEIRSAPPDHIAKVVRIELHRLVEGIGRLVILAHRAVDGAETAIALKVARIEFALPCWLPSARAPDRPGSNRSWREMRKVPRRMD